MAGTNETLGVALYDRWAEMWSGTRPADDVMASSFRLRYAQVGAESFNGISDVETFTIAVADFRTQRPGIFYTPEGPAVVDMDASGTGTVARPYLATIPGIGDVDTVHVSGTDILRAIDGEVVEVWSVSARGVPFYAEG